MTPALMTVSEVAAELGVTRATLYRHPAFLARLRAKYALGSRRYSAVLVAKVKADEPLTHFGRRSA